MSSNDTDESPTMMGIRPMVAESDVAIQLGFNPKTLARWSNLGRFPKAQIINRTRRYFVDEVIEWQKANKARGAPPTPPKRKKVA